MSRPGVISAAGAQPRRFVERPGEGICGYQRHLSVKPAVAKLRVYVSTPLLIAAILLSGCANTPPTLFTGVRTVEVRVPVPIPCIDTVPTPPRTEMPMQGDINQLSAGLELDIRAMDAYIELVDKILKECAAK